MSRSGTFVGPTIVWFRNDLRLADNCALQRAVRRGAPVIPVYIWAPEEEGDWPPGAASRWWLHQSLSSLQTNLERLGAPLVLRHGSSSKTLLQIAGATDAGLVVWNKRYDPAIVQRDSAVERELQAQGIETETCEPGLLTDPWTVRNSSGKPFKVFSAFWRNCLDSIEVGIPTLSPRKLSGTEVALRSIGLASLKLEPRINWAKGIAGAWQPGEPGARRALNRFCGTRLGEYRMARDRPAGNGTSRLSPHLHFGEITARQVWHALKTRNERRVSADRSWQHNQFMAELGWREFAHHLLCHFPHTPSQSLRSEFDCFPWKANPECFQAWQRGQTGYPMVDAGMRQLWITGWMHNRVRMIVASFLVKDLLISWQEGARWFWDTLVDADLANNTLGWQWTAGCGADAAPFFRIFNPAAQGEKFDSAGEYVRRWVPELARLPSRWIHQPWRAPEDVLRKAEVDLGVNYPKPMIDHRAARDKALHAFELLKAARRDRPIKPTC